MREIKFRAWHNISGIMCIDLTVWRNNISLDKYFKEKDFIFMQYTGLKDKNGKEIYEGDVIQYKEIQLPVVFRVWSFQVEYKDTSILLLTDLSIHSVMLKNKLIDLEIIWNIYENPDLIK